MRRRFQFSLKALLFGTALVGVLLSGVIWKIIPIGFTPLAFMMACILFDLLTSRRPNRKR
jgi:hypothetical protein